MRRFPIALAAAFAVAGPAAWAQSTPTAAAASDTGAGRAMIVLDGSDSMGAPVNGRPRIAPSGPCPYELRYGVPALKRAVAKQTIVVA